MCVSIWKHKVGIVCLSQSLYTLLIEVRCQTEHRACQCWLVKLTIVLRILPLLSSLRKDYRRLPHEADNLFPEPYCQPFIQTL